MIIIAILTVLVPNDAHAAISATNVCIKLLSTPASG
jgi:hypothetical protein